MLRRWVGLAVVSAATVALLHHNGLARDKTMPGPAAQRSFDAVVVNEECVSCHQDIAAEWRHSLHKQAHTVSAYQRAYAIEPLAFCRSCHAPEADPRDETPAREGAIGVACVSCHVVGDHILAGAAQPHQTAATGESHAVVRDAGFAGVGACAGCHEFTFPRQVLLMQSTVAEHAQSPHADKSCAGCHMPLVRTAGGKAHRSHAFAASRDAKMLRGAVAVDAQRAGDRITVTLTPNNIGHAFPTGDLFRRVEVLLEAVGEEYNVVAGATEHLARHFRVGRGPDGRLRKELALDNRVNGGPKRLTFDLGADARGWPVHYRVAYQRVQHPITADASHVVVEGEVVLAEGILAPRKDE